MTEANAEKLWRLCEEGLTALGYDLVELEFGREGKDLVLRVFIDHQVPSTEVALGPARSTINHLDCEKVSRHLGPVLDVEDPIDTQYRLEVSSPGIRRPLRKERDFARFAGQLAKIQLQKQEGGRKNYTGRLVSADGGVVTIEVDGQPLRLPLESIRKARLEVELQEGN
jgi:ribosome maturation factor RimP